MPATPANAKKPKDHKSKNTFGQRVVWDVEVPSGSVIKMTRPGVQGLTKAGLIDSFDTLTTIVQGETIPKAQGLPAVDYAKAARAASADPARIQQMLDMMDKIAMHVVVEPRLSETPVLSEEDKAAGKTLDDIEEVDKAYIHYVSEEDKAFIMNVAMGGSTDLERFRAESSALVAGVHDGEATEEATE